MGDIFKKLWADVEAWFKGLFKKEEEPEPQPEPEPSNEEEEEHEITPDESEYPDLPPGLPSHWGEHKIHIHGDGILYKPSTGAFIVTRKLTKTVSNVKFRRVSDGSYIVQRGTEHGNPVYSLKQRKAKYAGRHVYQFRRHGYKDETNFMAELRNKKGKIVHLKLIRHGTMRQE